MAGIVEFQVAGRVSQADPEDRPPTRTDGIVVGEIVDRWLVTAETAITEVGLGTNWPLAGFERVHGRLSPREAALLLEPGDLRTIDISLSLEGGAKTGRLRLSAPPGDLAVDIHGATTAARVRGHLPDLRVDLRAVLIRLPQAVGAVGRLRPGEVLGLPDGCLQRVRLETCDGRLIREVQLGELDGQKAVRLFAGAHAPTSAPLLPQPSALEAPGQVQLPTDAGLPDLPSLPGADVLATIGDGLPDLPEAGALPDLPDLPDLPGGSDLPPLP